MTEPLNGKESADRARSVLSFPGHADEVTPRSSVAANFAFGAILAGVCGLPLVFIAGALGIVGLGGAFCGMVAILSVYTPGFFLARRMDSRGRHGVLAGALTGMGVCILAAGGCFIGNM